MKTGNFLMCTIIPWLVSSHCTSSHHTLHTSHRTQRSSMTLKLFSLQTPQSCSNICKLVRWVQCTCPFSFFYIAFASCSIFPPEQWYHHRHSVTNHCECDNDEMKTMRQWQWDDDNEDEMMTMMMRWWLSFHFPLYCLHSVPSPLLLCLQKCFSSSVCSSFHAWCLHNHSLHWGWQVVLALH